MSDRSPQEWKLKPPFGTKAIVIAFVAFILLAITGKNTEMGKLVGFLGEWGADIVGAKESSQVGRGTEKLREQMFPLVIAERTSVERIENFDPDNLPTFAYVEKEEKTTRNYNPQTLQLEEKTVTNEVLVEPFGYLVHVGKKMLQSLEIALWGTIVSIIVSIPLAYWSAAN